MASGQNGSPAKKATPAPVKKTASAPPSNSSTSANSGGSTDPQGKQAKTSEQGVTTKQDNHENTSTLKAVDLGYTGKPKKQDQDFTYPTHTDPARKLPKTSLYLDDVQRENAEIQRAKVEGREPDLENPSSTQGTPLLPSYVVQSSLPGDHVVSPDVTLPVVVGRKKEDSKGTRVQAVPTFNVNKRDLDGEGRVKVGTDS